MNLDICQCLEDFHDNLLNQDQRREFEDHLAKCESCQIELRGLQQMDQLVSTAWNSVDIRINDIRPTYSLPSKILPIQNRSFLWTSLIVAALLMLSGLSIVLIRSQTNDEENTVRRTETEAKVIEKKMEAALSQPLPTQPIATVTTPRYAFSEPVANTPTMTVYAVYPKSIYKN